MSTVTKKKVVLPKTLRSVLSRLNKLNTATIVKTAIATGYLTDGAEICTKLTSEEVSRLKKLKVSGIRTAEVMPDFKFPKQVGLIATVAETHADRVSVTIPGGGKVEADPILTVLMERHPEATVHFGKDPHKGPIFLALRNGIAAVCPTIPEEKKKK